MLHHLLHAADVFFDHLTSIGWRALGIAICAQIAKLAVRSVAWRNIIAAAYPRAKVRWLSVFGSYLAGVGVNAILPARGGDALKLYLVKQRVEGSTYPTLIATLFVDTLFDFVVSGCLVIAAVYWGVIPNPDILGRLQSIDWSWAARHPHAALVVAGVLAALGVAGGVWTRRRVVSFGEQLREGGAILRTPRLYLLRVVSWQALDWVLRLTTVFWFLRAFGLPATLHNALLVQVASSLSTVLPLTPGGVGTEQGLIVYALKGKAPSAVLLSFSIGVKITLVVVNVILGFTAIVLMLGTFRWRERISPPSTDSGRP
jgi:uncharacterized membrane protein YbhN (UPF0104 family)